MELKSNPVSLAIKSSCFRVWCFVVLMTGWISLEWQGKMYWMSGSPVYLPASTLAPQEIDMLCHCKWLWVSHRQEDDGAIGCFLCTSAFLPGVWYIFVIPQQSAVPSASQSKSVYISCPAVNCKPPDTPVCLMGQDEICVRSCLSGRWVGYPKSSRDYRQSVRSLGL